MTIDAVGVITLLIGLLCLRYGPGFSLYTLWLSMLFGASAALILTSMGGANLSPAHVLLGFITASLAVRPAYLFQAMAVLKYPRVGFWLLLTVVYATATAVFMPRLFAGATSVFAIARTGSMGGIVLVPLGPVSGNITQTIYFIGDFFCFLAFYAYCSRPDGMCSFAHAGLACACAHIGFGCLDYVTYLTGTTELLSFIRNGTYALLTEVELAGFKRVVGSFTEASAFGAMSVFLFAFCSRLWLGGVYPRLTGVLSVLLAVALVCSTSTTGYAGISCFFVVEYLRCVMLVLSGRRATAETWRFLTIGPILAAFVVASLALHQPTWATITEIYRITFVNKLSSDSGIERSSWNRQAVTNVIETNGFGVGVGSTRTSSWLLAVPASLGVFGTVTYLAFVLLVVNPFARCSADPFVAAVQRAARASCLAQLIVASIGGAFIDLGLPFFVCAAASVAVLPKPARRPARVPPPALRTAGAVTGR